MTMAEICCAGEDIYRVSTSDRKRRDDLWLNSNTQQLKPISDEREIS